MNYSAEKERMDKRVPLSNDHDKFYTTTTSSCESDNDKFDVTTTSFTRQRQLHSSHDSDNVNDKSDVTMITSLT